MLQVTILSRPDCHLCTVVWKIASRLQAEFPFDLSKQEVDADPALSARYGARLPVVLMDGIERCSGKVTERTFRHALKRARWSRPISRILSRLRPWLGRGRSFL